MPKSIGPIAVVFFIQGGPPENAQPLVRLYKEKTSRDQGTGVIIVYSIATRTSISTRRVAGAVSSFSSVVFLIYSFFRVPTHFKITMMLPRSMRSITGNRIFHTATVRAFQSTAKKSLTIPFLPVLPQKPGGVKGTPNDAYVPPRENRLEGSYHWYMEKIFTLSVVPLATTAMLTTGPLSTAADSFFSVMLLGYCYMEFNSCITDYISERVYGVWHKYAMYLLGLGSAVSLFGIYKLETENDGVVGLVKSLWDSSKRNDSEEIAAKK